jgi:hypothetical protein
MAVSSPRDNQVCGLVIRLRDSILNIKIKTRLIVIIFVLLERANCDDLSKLIKS